MTIGLDPLRDVRGVGIDQYKAGLGEYLDAVASDAWASGPLSSSVRLLGASIAQTEAQDKGETMLSAEEASTQGRELGLRFDQPIAQGAYDVLAGERQRESAAEATFKRARLENGYGTLHWLLGGGAEFLTQAVDPLNVASAFVPVVGEARYASLAARLGKFPAALVKGAAEGAVGQALLEPITALERRQMGDDYTLMDTLINLGFGGGLGVALHGAAYGAGAGFRFIRNRYETPPAERGAAHALPPADLSSREEPRPVPGPPPRQPVAEQMETLRPETKDAAMRTAVAQLAQDKPVDIEPVLAADPAWPRVKASIEDMQGHVALQKEAVDAAAPTPFDVPADFEPTPEERTVAQRAVRGWLPWKPIEAPLGLADFVRRMGGLAEGTPEAQEIKAADLGEKLKGLVVPKERARDAEHLAQAAREGGYNVGADTRTGSGVDIDAFTRALVEDASGGRQHLPEDSHTATYQAQQEYFNHFAQHLRDLGVEPKGMDARRLAYLLRQDPHTGRLMALIDNIDKLGDSASLELVDRLDREAADLELEILRGEPGALEADAMADHRDIPPATLDELEKYYALEERSLEPGAGGGPAAEPRPAGGRPAQGGEAAAARPGAREAAPEATGLRPEGSEGQPAADPRANADLGAGDLSAFAERQQKADLHADPDALAARDERLQGEPAELDKMLQQELASYGHLLSEDERLLFDELGRQYDEQTKASDALAACRMGGG
jgi:hypothetical protein